MLKAAQALEWARFLELAQAQARTALGKLRLRALGEPGGWDTAWAPDVASARLMQQESQECSPLLDRDALWGPLTDLPDPSEPLERLGLDSVLELEELALLRRWLYAIDSWSQTPREELRGELFKKALLRLPDAHQPLRVLERVLTPEGELSERATPRLGQLLAEIRGLKREIGLVLDQLLKTFSQKGVLQENFTDVRDGRYVLPVKISSQGEVEGTIYEASASRQTVFIEPREVGNLNNRLRQRQNDWLQEVHAILQDASKQLKPYAGEIALAVGILAHWDAAQAKARLGLHYSGKAIHVAEERAFLLHQTAHPLLYWSLPSERIIRNEVDFGEPVRTLLLTGPNTGGKTVLLKTLGLAGFCARTGFPFPATDHPVVPFFETIFADLGDNQSIEEHLSSFSGHIARFRDILEKTTPRSLVLIDELNSATDPEEGAALGRAFLETVMARGSLIVTTTHDPQLKAAAVADGRILNASMQFDEAARTPTYRIALGIPGRSRALETAERLGIPEGVLALARTYLSREHLEFEAMLAKLENDARETDRARREAVQLREEALRLKKEWTEKTELAVHEMLDRTRLRLRRIQEQAQDEMRSSVKKLDELRNRAEATASRNATQELNEARARINEAFSLSSDRLESALQEEAPEIAEQLAVKARERDEEAKAPARAELRAGTPVRIPKWKSTGTVVEIQGGGKVKVAMGTIQMSLHRSDVEPLAASEIAQLPKSRPPGGARSAPAAVWAPPSQLDLRGRRFDEAMSELAAYVDQAFRSGALSEVTIIHGVGTGALRDGAHKLLGDLPYVKEFRDGGAGHGGVGATVVEFEKD